jgi:nucleoside-diphosphate-sugar epimerase
MACRLTMPHLFCFGLGYCAQALIARLAPQGWAVSGTNRDGSPLEHSSRVWRFDGSAKLPDGALAGVTHLLISIPPDQVGDPVLRFNERTIAKAAPHLAWTGYLSTTGVYGDRRGLWVDEESALTPATARGHRRLVAERAWLEHFAQNGLPLHIFRLAGIYGPGRNQLTALQEGKARRIVKPGQVFSRIHVDDVAGVLQASIAKPQPGRVYNVCDDEPCPPQDVIAYAAHLIGRPAPPEIAFEDAELSSIARSFYAESKRVANRRIKEELGYRLRYPTYREGLAALLPLNPLPRQVLEPPS